MECRLAARKTASINFQNYCIQRRGVSRTESTCKTAKIVASKMFTNLKLVSWGPGRKKTRWLKCQGLKKLEKVNFEICIADLKASTCSCAWLFLLRCVNPAALPLARCYSIRLPRCGLQPVRTESRTVGTTPVISACWRLMHYDVKNSGVRDRTHDLWIRKRAYYPLHHSTITPQRPIISVGCQKIV